MLNCVDRELVIGVAIADMAEFVAIDAAYGIGDQRLQIEALVEHELRTGGLDGQPGRVRPTLDFREFSSTSIDHKRAVADAFARDDVFAVLGARDFTYGSVRLTEVHHVPVLDVNAVPRAIFARTDPWLFTVRTAQDLVYLTYVEWAHAGGRLDRRRIGVFSDRYTAGSAAIAIARLRELGFPVADHIASDGVGVGSAHDAIAARRFAEAGVDIVMPFVSGSSLAGFLRAADEIDYRPEVLDLETGEHATDVSGSVMPDRIYEGTSALVMSRVGEVAAGRPLDERAEEAVSVVEQACGVRIPRSGRDSSGALSNVLLASDLVRILFIGLRTMGESVDRPGFVAALERIDNLPSASGGAITFRPGEHWGCREMREIVWRDGSWRVVGDYGPIVSAGGA